MRRTEVITCPSSSSSGKYPVWGIFRMPNYKRSPESPLPFSEAWVPRFSGCKAMSPATSFTVFTWLLTRRRFANMQKEEAFRQIEFPRYVGSSTPPRPNKRSHNPLPLIAAPIYLRRLPCSLLPQWTGALTPADRGGWPQHILNSLLDRHHPPLEPQNRFVFTLIDHEFRHATRRPLKSLLNVACSRGVHGEMISASRSPCDEQSSSGFVQRKCSGERIECLDSEYFDKSPAVFAIDS